MYSKTIVLALAASVYAQDTSAVSSPTDTVITDPVSTGAMSTGAMSTPVASSNETMPAMSDEVVTTTKVVSVYTTYCPEATTVEMNGKTYTASSATTITITDCPCTIVEPCHTCKPTNTAAPPPPPPCDTCAPPPQTQNPPTETQAPPPPPPCDTCTPPVETQAPPPVVAGADSTVVKYGMAVMGAVAAGVFAL